MPARACLLCGRPAISGLSRCSKHRRGGRSGPNPYDANHQRLAAHAIAAATNCALCGQPLDQPGPHATGPYDPPQGDHITPLSQGGTTTPANYQATHRSCNIRKGGANRRGGGVDFSRV